MITCRKCGERTEEEVELHHKIPKFMGGTDLDGRVYLCKKCHSIWHNILPKFIFSFVPEDKKKECQQYIKKMCEHFIES